MKTVHGAIVVSMVFLCLAVAAVPVAAEWIENGTPVCVAAGNQHYMDVKEVAPGFTVFTWGDARNGSSDIYAQAIDHYGNTLWTADGVPVCTETGEQGLPVIALDGTGGVIIAWTDSRSGTKKIYAQRLDMDGNALWASGGVAVCTAAGGQEYVRIASDGAGGAIMTWQDDRYTAADMDIYAQRVNASGTVQWASGGVSICGASDFQGASELMEDGAGGALIAWIDSRNGNQDIYAQRINGAGVTQWTSNGVIVTSAAGYQQGVLMLPDGYGGAMLAWQDDRSGIAYDIYAQRMDSGGNMLWTAGGEAVCSTSGSQYLAGIITDGADGAIVTWDDLRSSNGDVYAQRINRNGLSLWATNGIAVCSDNSMQWLYGTVPDGAGGAILSWTDFRSGDEDIYVQRIEGSAGMSYWTAGGIPLSDFAGDQSEPYLVSDGAGGAIAVWHDSREDVFDDLYAQRVVRDGFWGYPCPWIFEAEDVPNDQGSRVMLTFSASRLDSYTEGGIQYYSVWRQLGMLETQALVEAGTKETSPEMVGPDFDGDAVRFVALEGAMYGFEWLANVDAHEMPHYSYAAATLYDSTAADPGYHTFMVSAHYYLSGYWDSPPVTSYSVDNLSPCAPLALAGEQMFTPAGMDLTWDPNIEADLGGYNIYRDIGSSYQPGPGNLIATTCDENLFDGDWGWDVGFCYKVSAVDIHGNESDFAVLCSGEVTGDDPMPLPDATFLDQNFPNPFNPNTTIAFGLKAPAHVSLRIFDAAGRLVANLVDESRPAGSYSVNWNGAGADGRGVASGVYFYRLIAGEFIETRKMILLR